VAQSGEGRTDVPNNKGRAGSGNQRETEKEKESPSGNLEKQEVDSFNLGNRLLLIADNTSEKNCCPQTAA